MMTRHLLDVDTAGEEVGGDEHAGGAQRNSR